MNDKEMMSKVLESYIKDLREGKKPKVFEIFKTNSNLAKKMAPLIHIARLSMVNDRTMKTTDMDSAKSKKLSDELIRRVRKLNNIKGGIDNGN